MDRHRTRIVRFYPKQTPEIMPWLDAQRDKKLSMILLIKMAQQALGNRDVADALASQHNIYMSPSSLHQGSDPNDVNKSGQHAYEKITTPQRKPEPDKKADGENQKLNSSELNDLTGGKKW